ncbi:MAG: hypothetical protein ACFE96_02990 [Candidatus Hermodarchaeota archaeon]
MSIRGKKEGFFRILGSFLILMSLILSVLFKLLAINNLLVFLLLNLLVLPLFLLSVLLKLEQDFFVKKWITILLFLAVVDVIINIVVFFSYNLSLFIKFVLFECSDLLLIICWHDSLSLYKKRKIVFALSGFFSFVLNCIIWFSLGNIIFIFVFLMPTLILGILLIIIAELRMRKKGLLNYI